MDKDQQIKELLARAEELNLPVAKLTAENAGLRERLSRYGNPKNSRNSSIPLSRDENRPLKTKSLREKSHKRPGGQPGRKGGTLKMSENPDHTVDHIPCHCGKCGSDLSKLASELAGKRQVIDTPS